MFDTRIESNMSTPVRGSAVRSGRRLLGLGASAMAFGLGLSMAGQALAQAAPASPSGSLEEVVVSARRVQERAQTVPVAITALSAAALQKASIFEASDLQSHIPSLQVERDIVGGDALPVFTIRGLGQELGTEPTVTIYYAETPADSRFVGNSLFDLGSVQVLRGPQGTLFGKNSVGGAILFEPQRPKQGFDGFVQARVGNLNTRELTGVVNASPSDKIDVRLAVNAIRADGWLKNTLGPDFNNKDRSTVRLSFTVRPTEWLESYTLLQSFQLKQRSIAAQMKAFVGCPAFAPACLFTPPTSTVLGTPNANAAFALQQALGPRAVAVNQPSFDRNTDQRLTNITTAKFGEITLKNILTVQHSKANGAKDLDGTVVPIFSTTQNHDLPGYSEEFQVQGKSFNSAFNWILGAFYSDSEDNVFSTTTAFLTPTSTTSPTTRFTNDKFKSKALFAQGTYDMSQWVKGLSVVGGYRYTWDERGESVRAFFPGNRCALQFSNGTFQAFTDSTCTRRLPTAKFEADGYTFGVNYRINDRVMIYASRNKAYKAGGFSPSAVQTQFISFAPEFVVDTELGLKSDWRIMGAPLRVNVSLYKSNFTDIQLEENNVDPGTGAQQSLVFNGAKAHLTGGEVEVNFIPIRPLQIDASYSINSGTYDSLVTVVSGTPQNLSGRPFTRLPHDTYRVAATYRFDAPEGWGDVSASVEYYHQTSVQYLITRPQTPLNETPAYGLTNLRLDIANLARRPVDLSFYVKNVSNALYQTFAIDNTKTLGYGGVAYGEPRTYGVQLTWRFGAGAK